ncbi:MAG TPA: ATP-binding protein, partial [Bacteroidia bacterium]|nr:ATP-binding protein [Bacteroidia bacterium]
LGGIVLRKKLNLSNVAIAFIPFLGIALQNAYMYSVMDVDTLYKHTFAYIALFIGAGMFVIWRPVYSIFVISFSLIGNIILFKIFSKLSLEEILINGGLLTGTVAIFSILLTHARYHSIKKEIIARLQLEDNNAQILLQKNVIEKSVTELEKINNKLSRFAHIISHDLKAPLRGIGNLAQWIKEDAADKVSRETLEHIDLLQKQVQKMDNLIVGVLEYSKAGEADLSAEHIDLYELLNEITKSFTLKENDRIHILPGLPKVYQNKTRMIQVFQNLVGNAIRHNDKNIMDIKIYSIDKNDAYEFSVQDNGPGIAPEYHEKVFELFQVLNDRSNTDSTGIGLSIVKKIIEEIGGKIWIESLPGSGTTFKFTLPKIEKPLINVPVMVQKEAKTDKEK